MDTLAASNYSELKLIFIAKCSMLHTTFQRVKVKKSYAPKHLVDLAFLLAKIPRWDPSNLIPLCSFQRY